VIPCYCEESNIDYLFERVENVLNGLPVTYEIICIDDGSHDQTLEKLLDHYRRNKNIKIIALARNFGKEFALTAGLDYSSGNAVIPIDADLQDPPELIPAMIKQWQAGYDIVYAKRRSRQGEPWLKQATAKVFYQLISRISHVPIPQNTGDFRLMDRQVVEALKQLPERTRFMKGLFAWVGYKTSCIEYDRVPRHRGSTKWNYWRLWKLAVDGITSFSMAPLKIWSYIGLFFSLLAFLYATFLILRTLMLGIDVPGYASLMVAVLFLGGIQLMGLGIIGEYLGRIYEEVKERPLYLIRDSYGFNEKQLQSSVTQQSPQQIL
jgi:glycosyltransferase involved in cell wall biosynthesis